MCLAQSLPLQAVETTVRCTNCETDLLKVARFCECCGRELLAGQAPHTAAQPAKTEAAADVDDWAPKPHRNADLSCPSCAGPSLDGNRCAGCRTADSAMERGTSTTAEQSVGQTVSTTNKVTVKSASQGAMHVAPAHAGSHVPTERGAAVPLKPSEPEKPTEPAAPRRTAADAIYAEMLQRAASPTPTPRRPPVTPQTPATTERQETSVASERKQSPMVLASSGVLVAALVAGAYSLRSHEQPVRARQQSPAAVVAESNETGAGAGEREVPSATAVSPKPILPLPERKPAPVDEHPPAQIAARVSQKAAPSAARKDPAAVRTNAKATPVRSPRAAAAPAVSERTVRAQAPVREVPARVLPSAPVAGRPAVEVFEIERKPEPEPSAAVGPIFDLRDVSEQPRIATQHAPSLPPELRSRATKEIVVVRALVSQSGRPSRISLLRHSKTGPEVDDVVLASVNQWTFSPARKKGEPVNCWFNFAVQVGGTD